MISENFTRIEEKVDSLVEAVGKLLVFEERLSVQSIAITGLNTRVDVAEAKSLVQKERLDRCVNLVLGGLAVISTLSTVAAFLLPHFR